MVWGLIAPILTGDKEMKVFKKDGKVKSLDNKSGLIERLKAEGWKEEKPAVKKAKKNKPKVEYKEITKPKEKKTFIASVIGKIKKKD